MWKVEQSVDNLFYKIKKLCNEFNTYDYRFKFDEHLFEEDINKSTFI